MQSIQRVISFFPVPPNKAQVRTLQPGSMQRTPRQVNFYNETFEEWFLNVRLIAQTEFRWSATRTANLGESSEWNEFYNDGLSPRDAFVETQQAAA